ncbi:MAG: polyphosphate kinase 2 family protein [Planctomycetaceae bacterium]
MPLTHRIEPNQAICLSSISADGKHLAGSRKDAEKEFFKLRDELIEWQCKLYAQGKQSLLIVLQAMDAGGKDGSIRHLFKGVNPQGVQVASFKAPTSTELSHDYLWRIHQEAPGKGMIRIFNRSHYEDVLVVRVDNLAPEEVWQKRYEQINHFEQLLAENRTTILKFYLHISKDEQKQRFQDRLDDPESHWKFSLQDLEKRKQWDDYMAAYEDVLNRCSTSWAPWYVIPANQKWYRNLAIMKVIVHKLREMNPQYPPAEPGLHNVVIED